MKKFSRAARYFFAWQKHSRLRARLRRGAAGRAGYIMAVVAAVAVISGYWVYNQRATVSIITYDVQRDRPFIENLFQRDWYWLTDQQYDPALLEQWLVDKSVVSDPSKRGSILYKIAQVSGSDVGFVAYYLQTATEGVILFIDVQHTHRNNRIGRALLESAIKDLKSRGAQTVRLITRYGNTNARRLYERSGFTLHGQTPQYVFYEKNILGRSS